MRLEKLAHFLPASFQKSHPDAVLRRATKHAAGAYKLKTSMVVRSSSVSN